MGEKGLSGAQAPAALLILNDYTRHFTVFRVLWFFDFFFSFLAPHAEISTIYDNFSPDFTYMYFFPPLTYNLIFQWRGK